MLCQLLWVLVPYSLPLLIYFQPFSFRDGKKEQKVNEKVVLAGGISLIASHYQTPTSKSNNDDGASRTSKWSKVRYINQQPTMLSDQETSSQMSKRSKVSMENIGPGAIFSTEILMNVHDLEFRWPTIHCGVFISSDSLQHSRSHHDIEHNVNNLKAQSGTVQKNEKPSVPKVKIITVWWAGVYEWIHLPQ